MDTHLDTTGDAVRRTVVPSGPGGAADGGQRTGRSRPRNDRRPHPGHRRGGGTLRCDRRPPGPSERGRQRRHHDLRGGVDAPPGRIGPRARGRRRALTFPLRPTMSEPGAERATLFLGRTWKQPGTELSFVTRALAGAASRTSAVTVRVPSAAGPPEPDGAFDLIGAGVGRPGSWPAAADAVWPGRLPAETTLV